MLRIHSGAKSKQDGGSRFSLKRRHYTSVLVFNTEFSVCHNLVRLAVTIALV